MHLIQLTLFVSPIVVDRFSSLMKIRIVYSILGPKDLMLANFQIYTYGIVIAPNDLLCITDYGNRRVQVFRLFNY